MKDHVAKDYQYFKALVFLIYAVKDLITKSHNLESLRLLSETTSDLKQSFESIKVKGSSLVVANSEYLNTLTIFMTKIYQSMPKSPSKQSSPVKVSNPFLRQKNHSDDDQTIPTKHTSQPHSIGSFNSLIESLKLMSPESNAMFINDINDFISGIDNASDEQLKEFIRLYTPIAIEKENQRSPKVPSLMLGLNKLYVKLVTLIFKQNCEENLFFLFELIHTFSEGKVSINNYSFFYVFVNQLEKTDTSEIPPATKNKLAFLIIERLELEDLRHLDEENRLTLISLAKKLARLINFEDVELERALYLFSEFLKLEKFLSSTKFTFKDFEAIEATALILSRSLNKLAHAGILPKNLQTYLARVETIVDRNRSDEELVG